MTDAEILTVVYLLAAAIAVVVFDFARKKPVPVDGLRLFNAMFVLAYLVTPALSIIISEPLGAELQRREIAFHPISITTAVLVTIAYAAVVVGYSVAGTRAYIRIAADSPLRTTIFAAFLIAALVAMIAYSVQYGGIFGWIDASISARHLGEELPPTGVFAFVYKLILPGSYFMVCIAFAMLLGSENRKGLLFGIFAVSLAYFMVMATINGGRGAIFFAFLALFLVYTNMSGRLRYGWILFFGTCLVLVVIYGKPLISSIPFLLSGDIAGASDRFLRREPEATDLYYVIELVRYILHPSNSLQAILEHQSQIGMRYLWDIVLGLDSAVPSRLLGLSYDRPLTATEINSELLTGRPDYGLVPGQVAAWVYGFGVAGLLICAPISGAFLRFMNDLLLNSAQRHAGSWGLYAAVMLYLATYLQLGNPGHLVARNAVLVFAAAVLLPLLRLGVPRRSRGYRTA